MEEQYYMIYNTKAKQYQFPSIFCKTEKETRQRLLKLLGNDARKYRFETRKVSYSEGRRMQEEIRKREKVKRIIADLPKLQEHQAYMLLEKYGGE